MSKVTFSKLVSGLIAGPPPTSPPVVRVQRAYPKLREQVEKQLEYKGRKKHINFFNINFLAGYALWTPIFFEVPEGHHPRGTTLREAL